MCYSLIACQTLMTSTTTSSENDRKTTLFCLYRVCLFETRCERLSSFRLMKATVASRMIHSCRRCWRWDKIFTPKWYQSDDIFAEEIYVRLHFEWAGIAVTRTSNNPWNFRLVQITSSSMRNCSNLIAQIEMNVSRAKSINIEWKMCIE